MVKESKSGVVTYLEGLNKISGVNNREGFEYSGVFDFLLKEGKMFKNEPLNRDEYLAVEEMLDVIRFFRGEPRYKECFKNSQAVIMDRINSDFKYCEGYALSSVGLPIHHAFLTINDKVVDITWRDDNEEFLIGEKCKEYFGVQFNSKDVISGILMTECYQSHLYGYWNNFMLYKSKYDSKKTYLNGLG